MACVKCQITSMIELRNVAWERCPAEGSVSERCQKMANWRETLNCFEFFKVQRDDPPDVCEEAVRKMRAVDLANKEFQQLVSRKKKELDRAQAKDLQDFPVLTVQELELSIIDLYAYDIKWTAECAYVPCLGAQEEVFTLEYKIHPCRDDLEGVPMRAELTGAVDKFEEWGFSYKVMFVFRQVPFEVAKAMLDDAARVFAEKEPPEVRQVKRLRYWREWEHVEGKPPSSKIVIEEGLSVNTVTSVAGSLRTDMFWRSMIPMLKSLNEVDYTINLAWQVRGKRDSKCPRLEGRNRRKKNKDRFKVAFRAATEKAYDTLGLTKPENGERCYGRIPEKRFLFGHDYAIPEYRGMSFDGSGVVVRYALHQTFTAKDQKKYLLRNAIWARDRDVLTAFDIKDCRLDMFNAMMNRDCTTCQPTASFVITEGENDDGRVVAAIICTVGDGSEPIQKSCRDRTKRHPRHVKAPWFSPSLGNSPPLTTATITNCTVDPKIVTDKDVKDELMIRLITTCVDYCRWAFLLQFFSAESRDGDTYTYEIFTKCGFKPIRYSAPFYENRDGVRVLEFAAQPPTSSPQLATIAGVDLSWD